MKRILLAFAAIAFAAATGTGVAAVPSSTPQFSGGDQVKFDVKGKKGKTKSGKKAKAAKTK